MQLRKDAPKGIVLIETADGRKLLSSKQEAQRQLQRSKGGQRAQATGRGHAWNSKTARKAALKRWRKHPMTKRGYRRGQRFKNRPPVAHGPLRERYALNPCRGVQYSPALQVWLLTDDSGTRPISERTALRRLGHLPRAIDTVLPVAVLKVVKEPRSRT